MCASNKTCKVRTKVGEQGGTIPGGTRIILQSKEERRLAKPEQVLVLKKRYTMLGADEIPAFLFGEGEESTKQLR